MPTHSKQKIAFLMIFLCCMAGSVFANAIPRAHLTASHSAVKAPVHQALLAKMEFQQLVVKQSLVASLQEAKLPSNTLLKMTSAFGGTLNLKTLLKPGDRIGLKYEALYDDQKFVSVAKIVAIRIQTAKKVYESVLYPMTPLTAGMKRAYYNRQGTSFQPGFLRWPIARGRISSPFRMQRYHPILGITRPHTGTDFAAPYGSPIRATAKGAIIFEGTQGGYGRVVMLKNYNGYVTLYAHMSRFVKGLTKGSIVFQGQTIGYIGTSGLATGPHVHYEVRIGERFNDPLKVPLPGAEAITATQAPAFNTYCEKVMKELDPMARATPRLKAKTQ